MRPAGALTSTALPGNRARGAAQACAANGPGRILEPGSLPRSNQPAATHACTTGRSGEEAVLRAQLMHLQADHDNRSAQKTALWALQLAPLAAAQAAVGGAAAA